jgi:homoserine kinase type II
MRRSNRQSPLGSRSGAEFARRGRGTSRPSTGGEARRLTGLIHAAKRDRHRTNLMGSLNGRDMAVYTEVSDDALRTFLARYDIGEVTSFKGIAEGVENSNYLMRTTAGLHILTLYEKRVKAEDLPFFIGLMEHLAQRGVTCPQPVRNRAGSALGELAGRPATIVTFLDGIWIRRPNLRHCGEVGAALARMHLAGADFPLKRANALSLQGWPPLFLSAEARADEVAPQLREEVATELNFLQAHWPKNLPGGVIHADLFNDNVFFLGENLSGLIDFYFACNDALAYDLAICLSAWCFEPDNSFNVSKGRAMISAYQRLRPLSEAEIEALPLLARGAALRFMLTRLVDWLNVPPGAKVRPKNPLEYRDKLRFHQRVKSAADYGLMR